MIIANFSSLHSMRAALVVAASLCFAMSCFGTEPISQSEMILIVAGNRNLTLEPCGCSISLKGGLAREYQAIKLTSGYPITYGTSFVPSPSAFDRTKIGHYRQKASTLARLLKLLDTKAVFPNVEDFALGRKRLMEMARSTDAEWVSADLVDKHSGRLLFQNFVKWQLDGKEVFMTGLSAPSHSVYPVDSSVHILDPEEAIRSVLEHMPLNSTLVIFSNLDYMTQSRLSEDHEQVRLFVGVERHGYPIEPKYMTKGSALFSEYQRESLGRIRMTVPHDSKGVFLPQKASTVEESIKNLNEYIAELDPTQTTEIKRVQRRLEYFQSLPKAASSQYSVIDAERITLDDRFDRPDSEANPITEMLENLESQLRTDHPMRYEPKDAEGYIDRGDAWLGTGNFDEAIADYSEVLTYDPNNVMAYLYRGYANYVKGDHYQAIADYDQCLRLDPCYAMAYRDRAFAYHDKGDYNQAIADYDQYLILDPKDATAYWDRADAYYSMGDYDQAIVDYDQCVRLEYYFAFYGRGNAWFAKGNYDKAIKDYDEALWPDGVLSYHPERGYAYYKRGLAKHHLKDYEGAIKDYDEAISLDPKDALAYVNRGVAKHHLKDYEGAIKDYDEAISLDPKFVNAYTNLAFFLATCPDETYRDGAAALRLAKQALEIDSDSGYSWNAKACALAAQGDFEQAAKAQKRALEDQDYADDDAIDGGKLAETRLALWATGQLWTSDIEKTSVASN